MPKLSLTDFVDVVASSGTPKASKVKEIKNRPPYNPAFDFYKPLRDRIEETHKLAKGKQHLTGILPTLTDKKKIAAYPILIGAYTKWWGKKQLTWFAPPSTVFSDHGVDVSVNPELGLMVNGKPYLIKLYFKSDKLSKRRVDPILFLMESQLAKMTPPGTTMAVLDIRRSKLFIPTVHNPSLPAILSAELAYIAALWPHL